MGCGSTRSRLLFSTAAHSKNGHNRVEELWVQFFADPSQWWDHATHKVNPKYPDFKHKKTGMALWIESRVNPSWVKSELATMSPGSVSRSLYSWNTLISRCVKSNHGLDALRLYNQMQAEGIKPDAFTFSRVINACTSLMALEEGRQIHKHIIESGCESDVFVGSTLIDMYAKCGSIEAAQKVFYNMPTSNVVSWNVMLSGYVKCKQEQKALELFSLMQVDCVKPNAVTFVVVLNACASTLALEQGRHVHALAIESGCESDVFVGSTLVDMYAKCSSIEDAQRVFHKMPTRAVVPWTAMLAGYVRCEQGQNALEQFALMQEEGVRPNPVTFVVVLNACASIMGLEEGRRIHTQVIESGCESDVYVGCALVNMYSKCGSLEEAQSVFHTMPLRDVVSWNAMLAGYINCEQAQKVLEQFAHMQEESVKPNPVSFVLVLNACANMMALEEGMSVHAQVIESGYECDVFVANTLVDMYAKCESIEDAQRVFNKMPTPNVVSWNALLAGYLKCKQRWKVLEQFELMLESGIRPNQVTFVVVLNACARILALEEGRHVHAQVIEGGVESDLFVGNTLVDMYAKCGSIEEAQRVFQKMPTRNVVSWTAMLAGYVQCEQGQKALEQFSMMQQEGVKANPVTFVVVLNACASLMALEVGRNVHAHVIECGYECDVFVGNTLVDMYAKCGNIEAAQKVFYKMPCRDMVSWTAMLGGLAMHGRGKEALQLFQDMHKAGVEMDKVTFICLLSACSQAGLVEEGIQLFESMRPVFGISQTLEHYVCMVDLLGRAGRLDDAEDLLKSESKMSEDSTALMALLSACRNQGNMEMGERIAQQLLESDANNAAVYVLLSNIYATAGQWDRCDQIQERKKERGVKKLPGRTWIEVDTQVNSFVADDQGHPRIEEIQTELHRLFEQMEEAGYEPDTQFVQDDVEEEENAFRSRYHSEKLAIGFGLISTAPETCIAGGRKLQFHALPGKMVKKLL